MSDKPSSPAEWRHLKNRNLFTFFLALIFIIHALPGLYWAEVFPLLRWSMFSVDFSRSGATVCGEQFYVMDANNENHAISISRFFTGVGAHVRNYSIQQFSILLMTDSITGAQVRSDTINRLNNLLNEEVSSFELRQTCYDVIQTETGDLLDRDNPDIFVIAYFDNNSFEIIREEDATTDSSGGE